MATATSPKKKTPSIPVLISELRELVVTYAKQETVEPLKGLANFMKWGGAGAFLIALSGIFLPLGLVRLLQEEAGTVFDGNWSWAPYAIAMVGAGIGAGLAIRAIAGSKKKSEGR